MTDVLDELREAFARYSWGHYDPFSVIDAFAAEHPGLVDLSDAAPTICCERCRYGNVPDTPLTDGRDLSKCHYCYCGSNFEEATNGQH